MQMSPNDLNDSDRQVYRRWTIAFGIAYGMIALVFVAANTGAGQRAIESMLPRLTGDTVRISGLSGRFPDAFVPNSVGTSFFL